MLVSKWIPEYSETWGTVHIVNVAGHRQTRDALWPVTCIILGGDRKDSLMKRLLIGVVMIGTMAAQLDAETDSSANVGVQSVAVVVASPSWGWVDLSCDGQSGRRFPSFAYACDPLYGGGNRMRYPVPSVTVATPPVVTQAAPAAAPPEPPVRPVIHEYRWPSSESTTGSGKGQTPSDSVDHQARR